MAGSTGLAGLAVTALVAALVAFGVASLLGGPPAAPAPAPSAPAAPARDEEVARLRAEVARLREDLARLRPSPGPAAAPSPPGSPAPGDAPAAESADAASATVPDGPPPATRSALVALIDQRIAEREAIAPARRKKVTVEEACEAMGLTAIETDSVRRVQREFETELITSVMGTADLDVLKEEIRGVKDDPERKAALVQKAVGNMIRNAGRLLTLEDRRDRELKKFLTPDQLAKLKGYDLRSTVADPELESILEDVFGK